MTDHDVFWLSVCIVSIWVLVMMLGFEVSALGRRIKKLEDKEPKR